VAADSGDMGSGADGVKVLNAIGGSGDGNGGGGCWPLGKWRGPKSW
jgi:hypothetical protein